MVMLTYSGVDQHGNGRGGRLEMYTAAAFVEAAFLSGWRELTVWVPNRLEPVGGIRAADPGGRRRTWWAEAETDS